jgi:hypothetical protein
MENVLSLEFLANFLFKFLILILFVLTFTYIQKLENIGCVCSEHEYRDFIKTFSVMAIVYYGIFMFVSSGTINNTLGKELMVLYNVIDIIFLITTLFYFYYTIVYVRYLVNEKCKCSEDLRREIIMWSSIIEMFLLVLVVIVALILPVIGSVTASVLDNASSTKDQLKRTIIDPIGSLKSSPSKLKNVFQNSAKILKSSSTSLKNNLNKRIH